MFSPRGVRRQSPSVETQKHLHAVMQHHYVTVAAFKGKGTAIATVVIRDVFTYSLSGCRVGFLFPGAGRFQGRGEV